VGNLKMITDEDLQWLKKYLPAITINADRTEARGSISFIASYDKDAGLTWLLEENLKVPGEILNGTYEVLIIKSDDLNELPSLQINLDEGKINIDRHFNQTDGKACLCGPVERGEFLRSEFLFIKFLERLIIPFLYAQTYFDKHRKWPWGELAHGSAGILQSFANSEGTKEDIEACLHEFRKDKSNWPRIKAVLSGHKRLTESSVCFCQTPKQIRKCHPDVLFRMGKFRAAIQQHRIRLT